MIREFETLREFIPKVAELLDGKLFEHYILYHTILRIDYEKEQYLESYTIGNRSSWIVGFCTQSTYLIYGFNWTPQQLIVAKRKIDSLIYRTPFHFSGTAGLIREITSKFNVDIFKDRIFYENRNLLNFNNSHECSLAKFDDLETISVMMCNYFEDEYNGKNNKELDKMRIEVENSIKNGNIWILKKDKKIVSMCSTILTNFNSPIIGSFFTSKLFRNNGYGSKLLSHVSKEMIEQFGIVTLLADKNHPESIKVFENLNYKNVYTTLEVAIKDNIN